MEALFFLTKLLCTYYSILACDLEALTELDIDAILVLSQETPLCPLLNFQIAQECSFIT